MGKTWVKTGENIGRPTRWCGHPVTSYCRNSSNFCPHAPFKLLNSTLFLLFKFVERNFEGKPNLRITTLLWSREPIDVAILSRENQGHLLPRNPGGLAQGII
jgi:hypothetical protein